jgi:mitogen-activated protein kinase 15
LLLNCECLLKLADFGLARSLADLQGESMTNAQLTDYVATRWYRAPEILLGSHKYTFGVDMWSCGCILGELLTGRPIFPGKSTMNQLDLIFEVTGVPSPEEASRIGSPYCSQMLDVPGKMLLSLIAWCLSLQLLGQYCSKLLRPHIASASKRQHSILFYRK